MNLHLVRYQFSPHSTIGKLDIDGVFECYTLERVADGKNIPNQSAINEGTYPVKIRYSPHFGRDVLAVCAVKDRTDIEIHVANSADQLKGCIAVGQKMSADFVGNSQSAFTQLMGKFREPATITIESIHLDTEKPETAEKEA